VRPTELVARAKEQLAEMTGLKVESATGLVRDDEGSWLVTVVALELSKIPNTMDVLGLYEVALTEDGELEAFKRLRRYPRSAAEEE
jgi:hypothetical protein